MSSVLMESTFPTSFLTASFYKPYPPRVFLAFLEDGIVLCGTDYRIISLFGSNAVNARSTLSHGDN